MVPLCVQLPPYLVLHLDDCDPLALLGQLHRRTFTTRTTADDDDIVFLHHADSLICSCNARARHPQPITVPRQTRVRFAAERGDRHVVSQPRIRIAAVQSAFTALLAGFDYSLRTADTTQNRSIRI